MLIVIIIYYFYYNYVGIKQLCYKIKRQICLFSMTLTVAKVDTMV